MFGKKKLLRKIEALEKEVSELRLKLIELELNPQIYVNGEQYGADTLICEILKTIGIVPKVVKEHLIMIRNEAESKTS